MTASLQIPLLFLLSALSVTASALGAPVLCAAGLAWALLSAIGAARSLRLYNLLLFTGIAIATDASWAWCLLLSAPVTIAAIACTLSSPRYRGPGVALLVEKLQNKRPPSPVVSTWTEPLTSPRAALALDRVPANLRACGGTLGVGSAANSRQARAQQA